MIGDLASIRRWLEFEIWNMEFGIYVLRLDTGYLQLTAVGPLEFEIWNLKTTQTAFPARYRVLPIVFQALPQTQNSSIPI